MTARPDSRPVLRLARPAALVRLLALTLSVSALGASPAFALTPTGVGVVGMLDSGTAMLAPLAPLGLLIGGGLLTATVFSNHESVAGKKIFVMILAFVLFGAGAYAYDMHRFWTDLISGPDAFVAAFTSQPLSVNEIKTGFLGPFGAGVAGWSSAWMSAMPTHLLALNAAVTPILTAVWPERAATAISIQAAFIAACGVAALAG